MEIFCLLLGLVAVLVSGYSILELRHDRSLRLKASEELSVALKETGNAMISLQETHNALVKAQIDIDTRITTAEVTVQSLRSQMPTRRL